MDGRYGVRVAGPLAPYAQGFAGELTRLGYRSCPAQKQLQLAAQLSGWLADAGLDAV
jgi:integrase/recombinase XerD